MPQYRVTHTVVRREHLTVNVNADSHADALRRARYRIGHTPYAEYDSGEMLESDVPEFEVVGPDNEIRHFNEDGAEVKADAADQVQQ